MIPVTRYRITRKPALGGQIETWRDDAPTENQLAALEEHVMDTGDAVTIERVTTRMLDNVPIGLGRIHSDTEIVFELEY